MKINLSQTLLLKSIRTMVVLALAANQCLINPNSLYAADLLDPYTQTTQQPTVSPNSVTTSSTTTTATKTTFQAGQTLSLTSATETVVDNVVRPPLVETNFSNGRVAVFQGDDPTKQIAVVEVPSSQPVIGTAFHVPTANGGYHEVTILSNGVLRVKSNLDKNLEATSNTQYYDQAFLSTQTVTDSTGYKTFMASHQITEYDNASFSSNQNTRVFEQTIISDSTGFKSATIKNPKTGEILTITKLSATTTERKTVVNGIETARLTTEKIDDKTTKITNTHTGAVTTKTVVDSKTINILVNATTKDGMQVQVSNQTIISVSSTEVKVIDNIMHTTTLVKQVTPTILNLVTTTADGMVLSQQKIEKIDGLTTRITETAKDGSVTITYQKIYDAKTMRVVVTVNGILSSDQTINFISGLVSEIYDAILGSTTTQTILSGTSGGYLFPGIDSSFKIPSLELPNPFASFDSNSLKKYEAVSSYEIAPGSWAKDTYGNLTVKTLDGKTLTFYSSGTLYEKSQITSSLAPTPFINSKYYSLKKITTSLGTEYEMQLSSETISNTDYRVYTYQLNQYAYDAAGNLVRSYTYRRMPDYSTVNIFQDYTNKKLIVNFQVSGIVTKTFDFSGSTPTYVQDPATSIIMLIKGFSMGQWVTIDLKGNSPVVLNQEIYQPPLMEAAFGDSRITVQNQTTCSINGCAAKTLAYVEVEASSNIIGKVLYFPNQNGGFDEVKVMDANTLRIRSNLDKNFQETVNTTYFDQIMLSRETVTDTTTGNKTYNSANTIMVYDNNLFSKNSNTQTFEQTVSKGSVAYPVTITTKNVTTGEVSILKQISATESYERLLINNVEFGYKKISKLDAYNTVVEDMKTPGLTFAFTSSPDGKTIRVVTKFRLNDGTTKITGDQTYYSVSKSEVKITDNLTGTTTSSVQGSPNSIKETVWTNGTLILTRKIEKIDALTMQITEYDAKGQMISMQTIKRIAGNYSSGSDYFFSNSFSNLSLPFKKPSFDLPSAFPTNYDHKAFKTYTPVASYDITNWTKDSTGAVKITTTDGRTISLLPNGQYVSVGNVYSYSLGLTVTKTEVGFLAKMDKAVSSMPYRLLTESIYLKGIDPATNTTVTYQALTYTYDYNTTAGYGNVAKASYSRRMPDGSTVTFTADWKNRIFSAGIYKNGTLVQTINFSSTGPMSYASDASGLLIYIQGQSSTGAAITINLYGKTPVIQGVATN